MYEFWEVAYHNGWATLDQLKQAVQQSRITAAEYETITGEVYVA